MICQKMPRLLIALLAWVLLLSSAVAQSRSDVMSNGNFEEGQAGWQPTVTDPQGVGSEVTIDLSQAKAGGKSLKIRLAGPSSATIASRSTINEAVATIRRMFRWGTAKELVPASVLEAVKVMCFGLFFVNVAVWVLLLPDLSLVLGVPLAVQGLGFICVGTMLLPVGLHFSRSHTHTRISVAGLGVFAIAFAAFAVYAFWPSAR